MLRTPSVQVAKLDSKAVFYWALAPMVAFYAVFAAILLPNADALQPVALATKYCAQLVRLLAACALRSPCAASCLWAVMQWSVCCVLTPLPFPVCSLRAWGASSKSLQTGTY